MGESDFSSMSWITPVSSSMCEFQRLDILGNEKQASKTFEPLSASQAFLKIWQIFWTQSCFEIKLLYGHNGIWKY